MGLDNYAARGPDKELSEEDLAAFEAAGIRLCGGLLSGPSDSFRGKVYSDLVFSITGESLYQEWIPPETVKKMHDAFEGCDPSTIDWFNAGRISSTEEAVENLRKFFKICAERGLGLIGWW
jgi:hypothetical protein